MTRKKIRENLYIMLFRLDFYSRDELAGQAGIFLDSEIENASDKDKEELLSKFNSVVEHLDEIDSRIEEVSRGWTVKRIAKAELTILRLAVFEILYVDDVPDSVAINEAVELSKNYCDDKAKGFINGILASIVKPGNQAQQDGTKQQEDTMQQESTTQD